MIDCGKIVNFIVQAQGKFKVSLIGCEKIATLVNLLPKKFENFVNLFRQLIEKSTNFIIWLQKVSQNLSIACGGKSHNFVKSFVKFCESLMGQKLQILSFGHKKCRQIEIH